MSKIDFKFISKSRQDSGSIQQGICGKVIRRFEPFTFEYSPKGLYKIEMRAVWWKKEEITRVKYFGKTLSVTQFFRYIAHINKQLYLFYKRVKI